MSRGDLSTAESGSKSQYVHLYAVLSCVCKGMYGVRRDNGDGKVARQLKRERDGGLNSVRSRLAEAGIGRDDHRNSEVEKPMKKGLTGTNET